jgi:hypothetical protein
MPITQQNVFSYRGENGPAMYDESRDDEEATDRQLGGAAVAGGLAGLVLAGPIFGLLAAAGAAAAATTKGGPGKAARASGDAIASFGERLKGIDEKHHVIERTSQSSQSSPLRIQKNQCQELQCNQRDCVACHLAINI